jgi:AraC family transcriptional regulator of arabinose operon
MKIDREALELPEYLHLLTGHMDQDRRYRAVRDEGTDDWLLIATLSGSGRVQSHHKTKPGDLLLIKPGIPHDYGTHQTSEHWELLWAHFHPRLHWYEWLDWPSEEGGLRNIHLVEDQWETAKSCFFRAHRLASGVGLHNRNLAMNALEELILLSHSWVFQSPGAMDERIEQILEFIHGHLSEKISVQSLAGLACLSDSRFSHLFNEEIGVPPMQYVDLQRIERAKQLLERTTTGISHISAQVGLEPVYFSLRFKQHTGLSPRAYRHRAWQQTALP